MARTFSGRESEKKVESTKLQGPHTQRNLFHSWVRRVAYASTTARKIGLPLDTLRNGATITHAHFWINI